MKSGHTTEERIQSEIKAALEGVLESLNEGAPTSFEEKLISYDAVYEACAECHAFGNCTLKVQMGDFPPGTHFDTIWFMWDKSIVDFYNDTEEKPVASLPLTVKVG